MGCDMGCDVLFAFFTIMFRKMFVPQRPKQYSAGSCQSLYGCSPKSTQIPTMKRSKQSVFGHHCTTHPQW